MDIRTTFEKITEQLDMFHCPRCMAVAYGDPKGWELVIVNEVTDLLDVVCPDCLTEHDLTRADRNEAVEWFDTELRRILGA